MILSIPVVRFFRGEMDKISATDHWRKLKPGQTGHTQEGAKLKGRTWVDMPPKGPNKEFAPGIPKARKIKAIRDVKKPTNWKFVVQHHPAVRAGNHFDFRLGDPVTREGHSWAAKKELPGPGDKPIRVYQQPTHTYDYLDFEGPLLKGYGRTKKGKKVKAVVHQKTEVLQANDNLIRFNVYPKGKTGRSRNRWRDKGGGPEEFLLVRAKRHEDDRNTPWTLINVTKTKERLKDLPFSKPKYKEVAPEAIDLSDAQQTMAAKLDGGHVTYDLKKGRRPRTYSYREPKERKTGVIEHSQKVMGLYQSKVPAAIDTKGTILRGELYARKKGGRGPLPAESVGGMLNAGVWKSRALQERKGKLRAAIFDVVKFRGKDMTDAGYDEKLDALRQVKKHMPEFEIPDMAFTPREKKALLLAIKRKKHRQTHEGVILWHRDEGKRPVKAKFKGDHNVYIRKITPAIGKDQVAKEEAGALWYSWEPDGKIVGKVGTGFSRALRRDMWKRRSDYVGAVAKVRAQTKYPSGALGKPVFAGWHLDKNPETFWSSNPVSK